MATGYQHLRSETAGAIPTAGSMLPGQIAVNIADKQLFTKRANNSIANITPGGSRKFLPNDVGNFNVTANTMADVTDLSFPVLAGSKYKFKFFIVYTAAATTTGSRWSINGPATTALFFRSEYTLTATSRTFNEGQIAYNGPAACNASSLLNGNIAIIEGEIHPSATGIVIARFASEISASNITAKKDYSYVEYEQIG